MKNKLIIGMLLVTVLVFTSCQKDIALTDFNSGISNNYKDGSVVNGRFFFSSKETLSNTINRFKKTDKSILETKFAILYKNGFRSLKPIVNPDNGTLISKLSNEINNRKTDIYNKNYSEDDVELIPDPLFAAVINKDNEIIVGDSIYKFTKDKGLFFASIKDSTYLFNYLKNNKQLSSKTTIIQSPCSIRIQSAGITQVNNKISRYVTPSDIGCNGGSGGSGLPTTPITTPDENLQQIIGILPECSGSGSFFQNIFGKSYACKSYFDTRHRIKTEFWDQKWLIYASVGVLTKTQHRTLGIWWASKSDEIHLGINRILLKYKYNEPIIKSFTHPSLFNNTYKAPLYLFDGTFKVRSNQFGQNYYVDSQIDVTKNNLPFFNFNNNKRPLQGKFIKKGTNYIINVLLFMQLNCIFNL